MIPPARKKECAIPHGAACFYSPYNSIAAQLWPTDAADFFLLMYGQASAACNISFTAAAGGQVTFEAANSQYAGQPRYKYSFSAADSTNCGNADVWSVERRRLQ
jgi:hypothetical protein